MLLSPPTQRSSRFHVTDIMYRNKVLSFFDEIGLVEPHDGVDITDFYQLGQKFRNAKASKKRDFKETEDAYVALLPPPRKYARTPSPPHRPGKGKETVDELDEEEYFDEQEEVEEDEQGEDEVTLSAARWSA